MQADAAAMELAQSLHATQQELTALSAALDEETVAKQTLRADLEAALRTVADTEVRATENEANALAESQRLGSLQSKLAEREAAVAESQAGLAAAQEQIDGLQSALDKARADQAEVTEALGAVTEQLAAEQTQHAEVVSGWEVRLEAAQGRADESEAKREAEHATAAGTIAELTRALQAEAARRALRDDILKRYGDTYCCSPRFLFFLSSLAVR